jgi:hypothetical protein
MAATVPGPWHIMRCSPWAMAAARVPSKVPPICRMCARSVAESWQAEQAATMGDLTKVVAAAAHGLPSEQTQGAAVVHASDGYITNADTPWSKLVIGFNITREY